MIRIKTSSGNEQWCMNRLGKFSVNLDALEIRAGEVRIEKPDMFSVRKLQKELGCSNHNSSTVYYRILRNP